ncbi:hypothetical protein [Nannocystis punicea]|uniref:Concanavalin A-like lectin/glucanases superfamily protein n=1 Tax=Nannocystis punicea TaxID=2995304 RepID=A0ABY7GSF7_9BACT|nr:hypothetical protein [Nannocystis poenicansa]WAS89866.1 hypothetical protein O0S08_27045 [Nannocystis poenicansa]
MHALLCNLLTERDFRELARNLGESGGDEHMVHSLGPGSRSEMAYQLIELIESRGLMLELFAELLRLRPRQRERIALVARQFDMPRAAVRSLFPAAKPPRARGWVPLVMLSPLLALIRCPTGQRDQLPPIQTARADVPATAPVDVEQPPDCPPVEPPVATKTPCPHPELHDAPPETALELLIVSNEFPSHSERVTYDASLDAGVAAKHFFLYHLLAMNEKQAAVFDKRSFELCGANGCAAKGTPLSAVVFHGGAAASVRGVQRPRSASATPSTPSQSRGMSAPPDASTSKFNPSIPTFKAPEIGFVRLDGFLYFRSLAPVALHSCEEWTSSCAETVALPRELGRDEFTFVINLRLAAAPPAGLSAVEPYSDDCWWSGEHPLLAAHADECDETGRFALLLTQEAELRWLVDDGAEVGFGGAWSLAVAGAGPRGLVDANWHSIALVRRFLPDGDAQLEIWLDGELGALETSDSRMDLRPRWMDRDGRLTEPWVWSLHGDIGSGYVWDQALTSEELESLAPRQIVRASQ